MNMYRIIGADGRQYGPVSADQVREWIAQGRANGHTRVLAEGATDWKMLSEVPEFNAALGAGAGRPAAPTAPVVAATGGQAQADAIAQAILARDYHVEIGSCISRGWNLVFSNFWLTVGTTVLMLILLTVVNFLPIAPLLLNLVLWTGLKWMFLKQVRGQRVELSDAFAGFGPLFVPLMLFSLVAQILYFVGLVLCLLPGIYLGVAWLLFSGLLIMDKGLEFWPAMELSRKVVTRHWWVLFGLVVVAFLLNLLGLAVCLIGYVITLPITLAAVVYAYEDIFGSQARLTTPAPGLPPAPMPVAPAPTSAPPSTPEPPPSAPPAPTAGTDSPTQGSAATITPAPPTNTPANQPGPETSGGTGNPPPSPA